METRTPSLKRASGADPALDMTTRISLPEATLTDLSGVEVIQFNLLRKYL